MTLPLVLPPHLTRLEVLVPSCRPGRFWRHIAACTQLVSLTVWKYCADAAADHPSWMLRRLVDSLPHLQHFTLRGFGAAGDPILPGVLRLLASTEAGQQQQEEQGWDWADLAAPGLGATAAYNTVVVPPPNIGRLTALRTLDFLGHGYHFRCCGAHHWHALAECKALQQLHGLDAWQAPPVQVKLAAVTELQLLGAAPFNDTLAVLRAFPALQQLVLKLDLHVPGTPEVSWSKVQ
jgi:hypothetical protein